jgi:hypothetical protein
MDTSAYEELGKRWLRGLEITEFSDIKLNEKQIAFLNMKERFSLAVGGMASGKTLGWMVKFILLHLFFPGVPSLIGRKTLQNAQSTFMKDFLEICPPQIYEFKAGEHKIQFNNGSSATFFGLDALQGEGNDDLKKAVQNLKSHNFGLIFIDQLEEIDKKVFDALNSRLRWRPCKHSKESQVVHRDKNGNPIFEECSVCGKHAFQQMNMTMNPANHWSYDFFKVNPRPMTAFIHTSMLDNKANLSEAFITSELSKPKVYVDRFVHGIWDDTTLVEGSVFYQEWITEQTAHTKEPERVLDGIKIFKNPDYHVYQIGVDPSLGSEDPCAIVCVDTDTGEIAATYKAFVPTNVIVEKTVQMAMLYSLKEKPLVIPEATGVGQALVEGLKRSYDYIYSREVFSQRERKTTKKLGFSTNYSTKTQLIENFKELLQKHFPKVKDKDIVAEMTKFIYSDAAEMLGAGAQNGYHDDLIMATMLAFFNVVPKTYRESQVMYQQSNVMRARRAVPSYE